MYYVYILKSKKDTELYIGSTDNLKRRFWAHNNGKVYSTKPRRPFVLIYYEAFLDEKDARKREHQLKKRGNTRFHLIKRIERSLSKA